MIKITEETFIRELEGKIENLKSNLNDYDFFNNIKDIEKHDLGFMRLQDEVFRKAQAVAYTNIVSEFNRYRSNKSDYNKEHYLDALQRSFELDVIEGEGKLNKWFKREDDEGVILIKLREQGFICSYEFATKMLECMERN